MHEILLVFILRDLLVDLVRLIGSLDKNQDLKYVIILFLKNNILIKDLRKKISY